MANNYTNMSMALTLKSPAEFEWWDKKLKDWGDLENGAPCTFEWYREDKDGQLILIMEEGGDLEVLASTLQEFLKEFDPKGILSFSWADLCDKMRPGEFGGGACVITSRYQKWMNTYQWMSSTEEAIQKMRKRHEKRKH